MKICNRQFVLVCVASLFFAAWIANAHGQQLKTPVPTKPQQEADDDVVRVSTDLVQTGVSVFDKKGKFVEGLKKEDFELKVDGHPIDVRFFGRITAGSQTETARPVRSEIDSAKKEVPNEGVAATPPTRGRVIVFFVDDIHLAPEDLPGVKNTILAFIDKEMAPNDLVAVTSTSGQIGFLQQYTDNKDVLRMAVTRLSYQNRGTRDVEIPIMTEGQAVLIDQGYKSVLGYFVQETMRVLSVPSATAEQIVRQRARILAAQSAGNTKATLSTLRTLAQRSAGLPGRKLVFFFSDGFPLDAQKSDVLDRLQRITDAAIRSGVMIYTMDARGLVTDMMDATVENPPSGQAVFLSREVGEDVLNTLAANTGGRFIHNTNRLGPEMTRALNETSVYYLLAWRPAMQGSAKKFHRIEVRILNRPDLSVRAQRGYFDQPEPTPNVADNAKNQRMVNSVRSAINSLLPRREVPTRVALNYLDTTVTGSTLVVSMKVDAGALRFERAGAAIVDIAGEVYDAGGNALDSFSHRLTVTRPSAPEAKPPDVVFNYRATLKPGLYQVRVAARDRASGLTGSATEWVTRPDLDKQRFTLSSLIVWERKPDASKANSATDASVEGVSVDRRFDRSSNLRYLIYIYNAAHAGSSPDNAASRVTVQAQIFAGNQLVFTLAPHHPSTEPQDQLAYAAEIPLQELKAGHYILQLNATDRSTNARASQRISFDVQ